MTKTILLLKYGIESVYEPFIGDNEVNFLYGFNTERVRMTESYNTMERQKTYVANCEFITESESGIVTEKSWTFLTCPTGVFAVVEKQGNTETLHYILKDHQGSWMVVTDAEGTVEQELSYDAWGNLRDPDTWCVDTTIKPMFDRGYTGQEHLTAFGLVNMNGRMYDPVMSSFLSVDRYVQSPENAQGFNRYAYCLNNPLRYTDPTGWEACGLSHNNPFHDNWSRSFVEPVYEPRDLGIEQLKDYETVWMKGEELHGGGGGCSNSGDDRGNGIYSTPDDPPSGQKNNMVEEVQKTTNEIGTGITLFGGALKMTDEVMGGLEGLLKTCTRVCNTLTGVSIVVNAGINYYGYINEEISLYSMLARDSMTLLEFAISKAPLGIGVIPSICLTVYDIDGGFEPTIYNKEWVLMQSARFDQHIDLKTNYQPIYYRHGK